MVRLSYAHRVRLASVAGEVSLSNVHRVRVELERAASWQRRFILSFEDCRSCDNSGVALLVELYRRLGNRLALVVPKRSPFRRVLGLTALIDVLPVVETVDGALQHLGIEEEQVLPIC